MPAPHHPFWDSMGAIYCINLKTRPDRYEHAKAEFERAGISDMITFYRPSKPAKNPAKGIVMAYYTIFKKYLEGAALHSGPLCIFEDDVRFVDTADAKKCLDTLHGFVKRPIIDWDCLRLGHMHSVFVESLGNGLYRGNCLCTHCTVFSPSFVKKVLSMPNDGTQIDRKIAVATPMHVLPRVQVVGLTNSPSDNKWVGHEWYQRWASSHAKQDTAQSHKRTIDLWKRTRHMPKTKRLEYLEKVNHNGYNLGGT